MVEFEIKEMVELLLVIFLTVGVIVLAVNAFGGLEGIRNAFCSRYPEWCGEGPTSGEELRVKNSAEALKDAAEWVATIEDEGDIPDDTWERVCEERGWVYCLKTECEEIKREIQGKDKVCCAKDKCKSPLLPPVGGAISFADDDNDDKLESLASQIGKDAWVRCGDYAQIEYEEDVGIIKGIFSTKDKNVWYMYNLEGGWIWKSDLEGYENYRPISEPVGEEFFSKVDDIHRTIIQGLKGKRYDVPGLSGIKVIQDAVKSTNDDRLILHLANGNEVKIDHGDEEKLGRLADLADYGYSGSCTVYNFKLPQKVGDMNVVQYITAMGDPKYLMYYETFPKKVEAAWSFTPWKVIWATAAVGGILNIGMGGLKLTGKAIKEGTMVVIRKKTIKEAAETVMSKAVLEYGGKKTLAWVAVKRALLGRWIRQETSDAVENVVKLGFKRIIKREPYMKGLKDADVLADELYYVVNPVGRYAEKELPQITKESIEAALQNLERRGVSMTMDDSSKIALTGRLKQIRSDIFNGRLQLIAPERELMEKAVFGGELKEGLVKRTFTSLRDRLKSLFKKSDDIIRISEEVMEPAEKKVLDETVEKIAGEEFVRLNDLIWVPKNFRNEYIRAAEEAVETLSPSVKTKIMQRAENLVRGLRGVMGMPPEGLPSKGRVFLMTTMLVGGYFVMFADSKFSKYNEPCGQNKLCIFTPKGFRLENIEEASTMSDSLRDYWWVVEVPGLVKDKWKEFYLASPCQADLLVKKGKCKCYDYVGYDQVIVEIKQKVCCDPNDVMEVECGVFGQPCYFCANNQIPTDSESILERLNPSCPVLCGTGATYNSDLFRCEIEASVPGSCPSGYQWDSESEICWVRDDENLVKVTQDYIPKYTWFHPETGAKNLEDLTEKRTIILSVGDWETELEGILKQLNSNFQREFTNEDEYGNRMYWVLSDVLNQASGVVYKYCSDGSRVEVDCIQVEVKNQDRYKDSTDPNFCIDSKGDVIDYIKAGVVVVEIVGSIAIMAFTGGAAAPVSLFVLGSGGVVTTGILDRAGAWPKNQHLN